MLARCPPHVNVRNWTKYAHQLLLLLTSVALRRPPTAYRRGAPEVQRGDSD